MFVQHCKYYWTSTKQTKIKKGQDWRKVNFMEFWCAKSFFMMRRWYQSLAFLNMSLFWGNTFFFPSHERKTYIIFRSEALTQLLKTCFFFYSGAIFRLLPDADHYDMQHMAVHRNCDWSRVGLLSCVTAD